MDIATSREIIVHIVNTFPTPITSQKLNEIYHSVTGEDVPYLKFGFDDMKQFLHSMNGLFKVDRSSKNLDTDIVTIELKKEIEYISKLYPHQKTQQRQAQRFCQWADQNSAFQLTDEILLAFKKKSANPVDVSRDPRPQTVLSKGCYSLLNYKKTFIPQFGIKLFKCNTSSRAQQEPATVIRPELALVPYKNYYKDIVSITISHDDYLNESSSSCSSTEVGHSKLSKKHSTDETINCTMAPQVYKKINFVNELDYEQYGCQGLCFSYKELGCLKDVSIYPENVIQLGETIVCQFLSDKMGTDDRIRVFITSIYDPSKFWLQLLDFAKEFEALYHLIQSFYNTNKNTLIIPGDMLTVGLYCIAECYDRFNRAIILQMLWDSPLIKIYCIDYGITTAVNVKNVHFLHRNFIGVPAQAVRARLGKIYPCTADTPWKSSATERFINLVEMQDVIATLHNIDHEKEIIEIYEIQVPGSNIINLNKSLVNEGHAKFTNEVQEPRPIDIDFIPIVKEIHLYPTFDEMEAGITPNSLEMINLQEAGIPLHFIYPQYFRRNCIMYENLFSSIPESNTHS